MLVHQFWIRFLNSAFNNLFAHYILLEKGTLRIQKLWIALLKLSRNKKDLNDITAAPFWVSFSQLPAASSTKNWAAVTSLRSFLFCEDFSTKSDPNYYGFLNSTVYWANKNCTIREPPVLCIELVTKWDQQVRQTLSR